MEEGLEIINFCILFNQVTLTPVSEAAFMGLKTYENGLIQQVFIKYMPHTAHLAVMGEIKHKVTMNTCLYWKCGSLQVQWEG